MWFNKENETLIEYKKYDKSNEFQRQLSNMPAISHYKDSNVEWISEFDEFDNEIHCKIKCGDYISEYWYTWELTSDGKFAKTSTIRKEYLVVYLSKNNPNMTALAEIPLKNSITT